MNAPVVSGLHHLKLPVSDLDTSLHWYERVFDAQRLAQFDHFDDNGARYAVIVAIPGLPTPLELRWAPGGAAAMRGCATRSISPRNPPRHCRPGRGTSMSWMSNTPR